MITRYLLVLLLTISNYTFAFNIEFKNELLNDTSSKNLLFVYSGYGDSQLNYCNSEFFNSLFILDNYNYFNLYFDIFYLNNQLIPEQYLNFLNMKLKSESFDKVVLLNTDSTCLTSMFDLEYDIYSIGFLELSSRPTLILKYDFDKLFDFLLKLNLNLSSDVYYFSSKSSRYDIKNEVILKQLNSYLQFNIHSIKIKSVSELRRKLIELNKNDRKSILIFNIDFLYSDIHASLLSFSNILTEIKYYNRIHIPVNLNTLCSSVNNLLVLNLSFDQKDIIFKLGKLFSTNNSIIINSELVINLKQLYYLGLMSNLESDEYMHLFDGISKLY